MFGLCTVFDTDGSILRGSAELDPTIGPYFLKPTIKHEWPPEVCTEMPECV